MIKIRKAQERGHVEQDWLDSFHSFSFADYYDPAHMHFRVLRVINEDRVVAGEGFGTHPHNDMEIVTYVLDGALEHKDSMGNGSVMEPGDVQRMSAGSGVTHSEFNHSSKNPVHLLQIWIMPEKKGLEPGYEQKRFAREEKLGHLRLVASRDGAEGSVRINQDARIFASILTPEQALTYENPVNRYAWVQVALGELEVNGERYPAGTGIAVSGKESLKLKGASVDAEFLVFDLP